VNQRLAYSVLAAALAVASLRLWPRPAAAAPADGDREAT
jgi:hypothetical protein